MHGCPTTTTHGSAVKRFGVASCRGYVVPDRSGCLEPGRPAVDEPASGGCGGGGRRAQQADRHACHTLDRVRRIIDHSACESFQSAASGAATVITLAAVSRLLPSTRPPRPASAWDICTSDRLDGLTVTLLRPPGSCLRWLGAHGWRPSAARPQCALRRGEEVWDHQRITALRSAGVRARSWARAGRRSLGDRTSARRERWFWAGTGALCAGVGRLGRADWRRPGGCRSARAAPSRVTAGRRLLSLTGRASYGSAGEGSRHA